MLTLNAFSDESLLKSLNDAVGLGLGDVVYLGGSHALGLATQASDIDLFLIGDRDLSSLSAFSNVIISRLEGRVVDTEWYQPATVENAINNVELIARSLIVDRRKSLQASERELEFILRLLNGIPFRNHDRFAALQSRAAEARPDLVLFCRFSMIVANEHEDMTGFLSSGQYEAALFSLQRMVGAAVDAVLAALGAGTLKAKWRLAQAEMLAKPGWDIEMPGGKLDLSLKDTIKYFTFSLSDEPHIVRALSRKATYVSSRLLALAQIKLSSSFKNGIAIEAPRRPALCDDENSVNDLRMNHGLLPALAPHTRIYFEDGEWRISSVLRRTTIRLSPLTAEALWCFDGTHTSFKAASKMRRYTQQPNNEVCEVLANMGHYLASVGFTDLYVET